MIDPALSLSVSVQSNPGVYALMLGSGVSRSSGVPTGWEIVQDLIRKLAVLKGASEPADPEEWYCAAFGTAPEYSAILGEIAQSPSERMQLLRRYFEPSEGEREQGLKLPTTAHRSIADLIAKGYFRIVVTTNFDRLLERALTDVGIQPNVVSSEDSAHGTLPLAHSRCTILKVNGDYLDSRLKNTANELAQYETGTERLLDTIFDEYGLIICGWSGVWDSALRAAIERCTTRRFTTYWAAFGRLGKLAQRLIDHRQASVFEISGADEFFKDILDKVSALEQLTLVDPIPTKVAVARMKKYLTDDAHQISLFDLLNDETERAYSTLGSARFTTPAKVHSEALYAHTNARLRAYEAAIETLLNLMICGAYRVQPHQDVLLTRSFKRLADGKDPENGKLSLWNNLRQYPALLLLYGIGLAALCKKNYRLLRLLLYLKIRKNSFEPEQPVAKQLNHASVMAVENQRWLFPGTNTGLSDHLFDILRDPLREFLPNDTDYDQAFDWFEYLLCLVNCDVQKTRSELKAIKAKNPEFTLMAPPGRFERKKGMSHDIQWETELSDEQPYHLPEKVLAVIQANFFESSGQIQMIDKYRDVKAAFDRYCAGGPRRTPEV